MKNRCYLSAFAVLSFCALPLSLAAQAAAGPIATFRDAELISNYVVQAKGQKGASDEQRACEAKCRKDYRACYSRGEQALKPQVPAEPCTEEKVSCLRACARGSQ